MATAQALAAPGKEILVPSVRAWTISKPVKGFCRHDDLASKSLDFNPVSTETPWRVFENVSHFFNRFNKYIAL